MTKSNQKPLYGTAYMLDELGNLQSDGHGIPGLETMLSIGLSAMQQFTLILQTIQQLLAVYGADVDKIIKGNTNNIVFLKSNDVAMIDEFVSMSGKRHNERLTGLSVTEDNDARINRVTGVVTKNKSLLEEDTLSRNDFLQIKPRESIVLAAGENPIYNQEATVFPMSWRLLENQIRDLKKEYNLQTIPSFSSSLEFDPRLNQPNFYAMVEKRVRQARVVKKIEKRYRDVYDYTQIDIDRMDPDVYADEIMFAVSDNLHAGEGPVKSVRQLLERYSIFEKVLTKASESGMVVENTDYVHEAKEAASQLVPDFTEEIYLEGRLAPQNFVTEHWAGNIRSIENEVMKAAFEAKRDLIEDTVHFTYLRDEDALYSSDGKTLYVSFNYRKGDKGVAAVKEAIDRGMMNMHVEDDFGKFLYDQAQKDPDLTKFANGRFALILGHEVDKRMAEVA